ncbi:hypothetical protein [Polystyrenella longa]|nr:hypothetical protein [Polystyrenella longa]
MKLVVSMVCLAGVCGQVSLANELSAAELLPVEKKLGQAWEVSWKRFYRDDTHLFYDYLISYEPGKELAHLPTKEEVQQQNPNECGYGTGMEDGMISGGVMLSMILDRAAVTGEEGLKERAFDAYQGIRACVTEEGFVSRAICHEDLKSFYPNSSRDQYTHAVHALWHYADSPMCGVETKAEIGQLLSRIADRMTRNVIPENNYDSLRADGSRDTRGISRMWNVNSHEWSRLPMIYAAAWDVTGKQEYHDLWRNYIGEAVQKSRRVPKAESTYALLQMQISLEMLTSLETDPALKDTMQEIQAGIAEECQSRALHANEAAKQLDLTMLCGDWRTTLGLSHKGKYRGVWYTIRECGEASLAQLGNEAVLTDEQQEVLNQSICRLDYDQVSSNGIFFLQAAYWKNRAHEELKHKALKVVK